MGAAGAKWDEAKHFRGYHGRWAAGRDRSPEQLGGQRGDNAFTPSTPAAERRARKERLPAKVRDVRAIYDKRARGDRLTRQEENKISWASPRKIAEQRAKTGEAIIPRGEAIARERSYAVTSRTRARRTGIKQTFTGKPKVERGNYREIAGVTVRLEDRVRRPFDWRTSGKKTARSLMSSKPKPAPKPAPKPPTAKPVYNVLTSDARLREIAKSLGIELPKRAGRNQIIKLIEGH